MNRPLLLAASGAAVLALLVAAGTTARRDDPGPATMVTVTRGPLSVWASYPGRLEAGSEIRIASQLSGAAVLLDLLPEGTQVGQGDVVARFDASDIDQKILELEEARTAAETELEGLVQAQHPIDARTLELARLATVQELDRERRYLEESRVLATEGYIAPEELSEQEESVRELTLRADAATDAHRLTTEFLHPAAARRAAARLHSAESALALARSRQAATTIRAPAAGVVLYPAVHVGNEYRAVRVGDSVFTNQVFLVLPDVATLVAHCEIPEAELAQIAEGTPVSIRPIANPELHIAGTVLRIGQVAQPVPGQPGWQRYFRAVVALAEPTLGLRPGMSVMVNMLAYHAPETVLIPRSVVSWDGERASVMVVGRPFDQERVIRVGRADAQQFQVLDGLEPGERVRVP